jgi:hypothetical protein
MKNARKLAILTISGMFAAVAPATRAFAQEAAGGSSQDAQQQQSAPPPPQSGWQKFNGGWGKQAAPAPDANTAQNGNAASPQQPDQNPPPQAGLPQPGAPTAAQAQESYAPPATLTLPVGTFITVRTNEPLSSDHNQQGDIFTTTLSQPVVINGYVVAQSGQTVYGRVVEAKKAGMVKGVSELRLELTGLMLVDGQTVNLQSQLVGRKGPTSVGRDAAAVGGTTALGAALGAAAGWGTGAAIGAGAGAAAGLIGVLFTRGYPTILPPETVLTFQLSAPVAIDTSRAPGAFQLVQPSDFQQQSQGQNQSARPALRYACGPNGCPPPYPGAYPGYGYYGPAYYPYYYGPFIYGPTFGFFYGPRYFYHGGYYGYGRGFGRGRVGVVRH